jgi:nitrite reductase/ring-hydroxylating ferredoxin subunit
VHSGCNGLTYVRPGFSILLAVDFSGDPTIGIGGRQSGHEERETMPEAPSRIRVCGVTDVASGEVLKVETHGLTVAVFNLEGEFYVTDDHCTHGPGSLSEGFIDGDCIECNFHQGVFNIRTGAVVQPPCIVPVKTYAVTVADGAVYIDHDARS